MTPKQDLKVSAELTTLAKGVVIAAQQFIKGSTSNDQFRRDLHLFASQANAIIHQFVAEERETSAQRRATQASLHQWALDSQTQAFIERTRHCIDRKSHWRYCEQKENGKWGELGQPGFIEGLEHVKGIPRITNGIIVVIERADGRLFNAHVDNFKREKKERAKTERKKTEKQKKFDEFVELLRSSLMA